MLGNALLHPAMVAALEVKTVPWVAANPLIPHDTWVGKQITLKGTCDSLGANFQWTWDFGDGSPVATGTVSDKYVIEARHAYTGATGTIFTARLTVLNTSTGETASKGYYVVMRAKSLPVEVNVAIDEGLWYLHKSQTRLTSGGIDYGHWEAEKFGGFATSTEPSVTASNVNAFEVNGHLETGNSENPYVETVARGLKRIFTYLSSDPTASQTNPLGTFNPDGNGNGIRLHTSALRYYQGGMVMDAIIASGTPSAVTTTGGTNVIGRAYKDIIQDMVDEYAWAQYDYYPQGGGWRYNGNDAPDNSACQWAAIGIIPAIRNWGCVLHPIVKPWNVVWLAYSQNATNGLFGYDRPDYYPWGPYATTPSGMVQMAMDGIGRGSTGAPSWDKAETYIRDHWGVGSGATANIKDYYYGLFSFVKSMLLHDANGDGVAEPLKYLQSQTAGVAPIDWYAYEGTDPNNPDPMDGVARTLVTDQTMGSTYWGYWYGHYYDYRQGSFETAHAIMMLSRTIFESGAPVAVAKAIPNPALMDQIITLDGSASFHQDANKDIDSWEWDFDNDGVFDASGPMVATSFPSLGDYPVSLRVTDDGSPELSATTTVMVSVTIPPVAPTADANGPYNFCPGAKPWFLDGSGSVNPDEGVSQAGSPPDTIKEYAWDLDGDGAFDDVFGQAPDVTSFFDGRGPGGYLIQLRVTDSTGTSFPSSPTGDLSDVASAQVFVLSAQDPLCDCVDNLAARAKLTKIQLTWTPTGADHYNIYRGTISGGPYLKIAETSSTYSTYLDSTVVTGTTYYYVVRPAQLNGNEACQSNQASARPVSR
jgi:PKD repeat protein